MGKIAEQLEKIITKGMCGVPFKQNTEVALAIEQYILNTKPKSPGPQGRYAYADEWQDNLEGGTDG